MSEKLKLTPYFSARTKPAIVGVYQTQPTRGATGTTFQHWDGEKWGLCSVTPNAAIKLPSWKSHYQSPRWRGLAENPEA